MYLFYNTFFIRILWEHHINWLVVRSWQLSLYLPQLIHYTVLQTNILQDLPGQYIFPWTATYYILYNADLKRDQLTTKIIEVNWSFPNAILKLSHFLCHMWQCIIISQEHTFCSVLVLASYMTCLVNGLPCAWGISSKANLFSLLL